MASRSQWRRQVKELCDELGWHIESETKHMRLVRPGCRPVFCPCTPSCWRALLNTRAMMVRVMKEAGVYDNVA